jgi:hypothetical protein
VGLRIRGIFVLSHEACHVRLIKDAHEHVSMHNTGSAADTDRCLALVDYAQTRWERLERR